MSRDARAIKELREAVTAIVQAFDAWVRINADGKRTVKELIGLFALVSRSVEWRQPTTSRNSTMNKEQAITTAKTFRKEADELLQRMKDHRRSLMDTMPQDPALADDFGEVIAQHTLSIRDLESCIMRQGMALKYIGNPDPYPHSKDPTSLVIEPTADGLKM